MNYIQIKEIKLNEVSKNTSIIEKALEVNANAKRKHRIDVVPVIVPDECEILDSIQVQERVEEKFKDFAPLKLDLFSLGTIKNLVDEGTIKLNLPGTLKNPEQRNIVHDNGWASNLVFDIIVGAQAIPSVILSVFKINERMYLTPIDGQQRLIAIYELIGNKIPFTSTNSCLDGHYFNELPLSTQKAIKMKTIVFQMINECFLSTKVSQFTKLNTTSSKLNSTELLTAMYSSKFVSDLEALIKDDKFTSSCVYSGVNLSIDEVERKKVINKTIDRKRELDAILFALANCIYTPDKTGSIRTKRRLLDMLLSDMKEKGLSKQLETKIKGVCKLIVCLFQESRVKEYRKSRSISGVVYNKDADGNYIHSGSVSISQLKTLFYVCWKLYDERVKVFATTEDEREKVRQKADEIFTDENYIVMKGYGNNLSVHSYNKSFAKEVANILGVDIKFKEGE